MAAQMVGGAFLSASLQVLFDRMASQEIVDFFQEKKLNERLIKKLKIKLLSANSVLDDAEEKQIANATVKAWLHELQAAVYDAEDLLQLINTEALRCKIELEYRSSSSTHHQVLNLFLMTATSFNQHVESKMIAILDTLEFILDQKVHLGLKEGVVQTVSTWKLPATSCVEESSVYGRDDDREAIVKSLLTNDASGDKMSVIPIVGMGGIGKTTLAQLVYNDERVKKCFDFKAWVCVSNEFDIYKITKTVAERVTSKVFNNSHDLDRIQDELKEALKGKKFLLVLDDVWNENYILWDEVRKPFVCGAYGSKIIVTTRSVSVALVMRDNTPSYQLQTISDENCWKLFVKHAFNNESPCAHPKLEQIGREIVKKCKGLPLAVKSLGSILRYKLSIEEWENVLKSDMWELPIENNNILPALWLSYHSLPSHLKRCFAYCSVFPKNYPIDKEKLIKLWMSEDLLKPQRKKRIEQVGEEYFHDLLSRSLFQQSSLHTQIFYTMHDLVHDLATFIAGEFCLSLDDRDSDKVPSNVRYMSHVKGQIYDLKNYEDLCKAKCLRTFFFPSNCYGEIQLQLENLVAVKLLPNFTCLRSLSLCGCSMIKLPDSIGKLKLLRYLNLSETKIIELPATICTLYNLQTLILSGCRKLKLLPSEMGSLINLRHLDITSTDLERMPLEMGNLKDLQTLTYFVAGKYSGYCIRLLRYLQQLHGKLCFLGLENVVNVEDVLVANLKEKKYLTELDFCWGSKDFDNSYQIMHREVLNGLQPHTSLELLKIRGYQGEEFPKWIGDPLFCNLEGIELYECRECRTLPPLGRLPFLKKLIIEGFDELLRIGNEFYSDICCSSVTIRPFRCLESLELHNMKKWEEWTFIEGDGDATFPHLKKLVVGNCQRLTACICFPSTIEEVDIHECKKLELSEKKQCYGNLRCLKISNSCDSINSIELDNFPMLKVLSLEQCDNLESLTYAQQPPQPLSLESLYLRKCPKLVSFPQGGFPGPNMKRFYIEDCDKFMRSLPDQFHTLLPSLRCFYPQVVESFSQFPLPSNSHELEISKCNKLISSCRLWDVEKLISLAIESIDEQVALDSFPDEGLLPHIPNTLVLLRMHLDICPLLFASKVFLSGEEMTRWDLTAILRKTLNSL